MSKVDLTGVFSKLDKVVEKVEQATENSMHLTVLNAVRNARSNDTYKDQTHFLRSSIGGAVYKGDTPVFTSFQSAGNSEGVAKAQELCEQDKPAGDYSAIVVAGAPYARAVESKGFDVITGATMNFDKDIKDGISAQISKIKL